jgi:hypothetical protein
MTAYPQINIRVDAEFLRSSTTGAADRMTSPGRPEAIRRLVELGPSEEPMKS